MDILNCLFSFSDRIRTTINVLGDSIGAGVVEKLSQADLNNDRDGDVFENNGYDNESFNVKPNESQEMNSIL